MSVPKRLSLLLVEDNPTDRLLIRESLVDSLGAEHQLAEASCLAECLELLKAQKFDAVLLDLGLPDSEGELSFLKILETAPDISLLVLTGLEDEDAGVRAMQHGAQDYLIKGQCSGSTLARSVRYAVERHRISTELRDLATRLGETSRRLMDSERRIREIIDSNDDAILVLGSDHTVYFANKSSEKIFGIPPEEMVDKPFGYSMGQLQTGGLEIRRERGGYCYVETRINNTVWDGLRARLVTFRDITKRKEDERALHLFRALIDHSSDALEIIDAATGKIIDMNKTGLQRLGYQREELADLYLYDFVDVVSKENWVEQSKLIANGTITTVEGEHRKKTGEVFQVEVNLSYVELNQSYIVAVVRDVTERMSLEEQLRQAQKMEAIGTLAGGIAHDFNNIMGAIRGFTELALRNSKQAEVSRYLETVVKSSDRAVKLIEKILTFSRKQPETHEQICLNDIVTESVELLRATIPSMIDVVAEMPSATPTVLANAGQIQQIILNLGTNALHALEDEAGKITIELKPVELNYEATSCMRGVSPGQYVCLSISDTGKGIPPEVLEHIFEPFFTTKEQGKGTGLGLAMVHGIIQQHNGAISVESEIGVGTTFRCYFPTGEQASTQKKPDSFEEIPGRGEKVLLVDDEESLLYLGCESLRLLNYEVDSCSCAVEALERATSPESPYDLVITDQTMPKMTGLDLAQAILEKKPKQRIIITTGYSATLTPDVAMGAGVRAVIRKPEGITHLSRVLHKVLKDEKSTPDMFKHSSAE